MSHMQHRYLMKVVELGCGVERTDTTKRYLWSKSFRTYLLYICRGRPGDPAPTASLYAVTVHASNFLRVCTRGWFQPRLSRVYVYFDRFFF